MTGPLLRRLIAPALLVTLAVGPFLSGQDREVELPVPADSVKQDADVDGLVLSARGLVFHQPAWMRPDGQDPWLGWVAFQPLLGDRVLAAPVDDGQPDQVEVVDGRAGEILGLAGGINDQGEMQLVWTRLEDRRAVLVTSWRTPDGWAEPVALPSSSQKCFEPTLARATNGVLWLAWREHREDTADGRPGDDLFAASLSRSTRGEVVRVTDDADTDLSVTLAPGPEDQLWLAWSHHTGRDYEVMAASLDPASGAVRPRGNVSAHPWGDDLNPDLALGPDGALWFAWDRHVDLARGRSERDTSRIRMSVQVACWKDGRFLLPQTEGSPPGTVPDTGFMTRSGGLPRIGVDGQGRLHLVYRFLQGPRKDYGYPLTYRLWTGAAWTEPSLVPGSRGEAERAAACMEGDRLRVASHRSRAGDPFLELPFEVPFVTRKELAAAGLHINREQPPGALQVSRIRGPADVQPMLLDERPAPPTERRTHALGAPEEDPILQGTAHHAVEVDGTTLKVFWGDLHRHSHYSTCTCGWEPGPAMMHEWGRDVFLYDFMSLTDHSGHMDPFQWWQTTKLVNLYDTPEFCVLPGYEWSHATLGHQNVIYRRRDQETISTDLPFPRTHQELWTMLPEGDAVTIPHHTAHGDMAFDWSQVDPEFLRVAEIYQASRGNYEFLGAFRSAPSATQRGSFVQDGLDAGQRFGLLSSSDHGNGASYAAVFAEHLDRDSVMDALRARRAYGCTTKGMLVDFRMDGHFMGEEYATEGAPTLSLKVLGTQELAEVVVFRNGELLQAFGREEPRPDLVLSAQVKVQPGPRWRPPEEQRIRLTLEEGEFSTRRNSSEYDETSPTLRTRKRKRALEWTAPARSLVPALAADLLADFEAPHGSKVTVEYGEETQETTVGAWRRRPIRLGQGPDAIAFQLVGTMDADVDPSRGMGSREFAATFPDDAPVPGAAWYYVRAVQTDGEIVWSSPIFVDRPGGDD